MIELRDAVEGLRSLLPNSATLLFADLPSGATKAEFDKAPDLDSLWPAIWDVLRPAGTVVFMCSSIRFTTCVLDSQEQHFRHDLIWSKSLATGHLNAARSPLRAHEFILVFCRVGTSTYNPQMLQGASPIHAARRRAHGENYNPMTTATESRAGATDRFPTSVLEFSSVGTSSKERVHPQQKPLPLLRWIVRTYTAPGDLVVDPYAGSGSMGQAALLEGRLFRGFDSSTRFGSVCAPQA